MSLPFSVYELADAVASGDVTARKHPTLDMWIYNYSPAVQYSNKWNDVTLNCRGLILDGWGNIVARPWKKFFNLGQVDLPIQFDDPVEVMDKADGSLGILYNDLPGCHSFSIATRGSFASDQAQHATLVWKARYADVIPNDMMTKQLLDRYTFLFEIVYPENRIVLNYDGMDDLIMLGAVEKATGYYVGPRVAAAMIAWTGPVVEVYDFNTLSDAIAHMGRANKEGYVIRSHNFMVKLKEPDYLELHRLVTNITPKTIWEQLRSGKSVDEICSVLPDEFHGFAKGIAEPLVNRYEARLQEILQEHAERVAKVMDRHAWPERKDFAVEFKKSPETRYHFSILDNKPISDVLWTELKPKEKVLEVATQEA